MQFNLCFNIYSNSLTQKDKKVKLRTRIFRFPDAIGQNPEPTIRRGTARKSLPPRGRGTAIAVEGACVTWNLD